MITLAEMKTVYNCKFHPRVESGEITEDEVMQKFMQRFGDKTATEKSRGTSSWTTTRASART